MTTQPLEYMEMPAEEMRARGQLFHETMARRRTVRDFDTRPVARDLIETALRTAGGAPSGANLQPWHFAVIGDPVLKRRLRAAAEEETKARYEEKVPPSWLRALVPLGADQPQVFLETAPWVIAVFTVGRVPDEGGETMPTYYAEESTGIAVGLLLAALHQAGLATLTHTPGPMDFVRKICGRPPEEKPFLLVVTGYPAAGARVPVFARQRKPLGEIASWFE